MINSHNTTLYVFGKKNFAHTKPNLQRILNIFTPRTDYTRMFQRCTLECYVFTTSLFPRGAWAPSYLMPSLSSFLCSPISIPYYPSLLRNLFSVLFCFPKLSSEHRGNTFAFARVVSSVVSNWEFTANDISQSRLSSRLPGTLYCVDANVLSVMGNRYIFINLGRQTSSPLAYQNCGFGLVFSSQYGWLCAHSADTPLLFAPSLPLMLHWFSFISRGGYRGRCKLCLDNTQLSIWSPIPQGDGQDRGFDNGF